MAGLPAIAKADLTPLAKEEGIRDAWFRILDGSHCFTATDLFMWHGDVVRHGTVDWTGGAGVIGGVDRVAWNFFEGRKRR